MQEDINNNNGNIKKMIFIQIIMIHNISIHLPLHTQLELTSTTKIKSIFLFHAAAGVQRRAWRRVPAGYNRVGVPIVVLTHLSAQVWSASRQMATWCYRNVKLIVVVTE